MDVAYSRRRWGNFFVTDNAARSPADFESVTITAPANPNLPGGGGYAVSSIVVAMPAAPLGATDNYYTFAKDFGDVTYYWQGVDFTLNARMSERSDASGRHHHGIGRPEQLRR